MFIQPEDGPNLSLEDVVSPYLGDTCELHLHYSPRYPNLRGGGSCLLGLSCPTHGPDPDKFLHFKSEGSISYEGGVLKVGNYEAPLDLMEGHYGRIIILRNLPACIEPSDESLESLLGEAKNLESLISGLKEIL